MSIGTKPLDQISEIDLRSLIENRVPESRELEFKRDPVGRDDPAKKEFLKDVSAFANTTGGDLIIGIGESDGVADKLTPISIPAADDEVRRLESILQDGLEPRLIGTRIRALHLGDGGYVLIVRVQRSWNAPHRVVYQRTNRFYGRNAGGAYELGVEQLRAAFLGAAETERQLTDFRIDRVMRLKSGLGPRLLCPGQLVLHIAPMQAPNATIDLQAASEPGGGFAPLGSRAFNRRPNFDGLLLLPPNGREDVFTSYTQIFRTGRLEAGVGQVLVTSPKDGIHRRLPWKRHVGDLVEGVSSYVRGLGRLGLTPPFVVMLSLLDVRGAEMLDQQRPNEGRPLDRDDLLFSPVVLEDVGFGPGWQAVLRPLLDAWWNAFGWLRCFPCFDETGNWTGLPQGSRCR